MRDNFENYASSTYTNNHPNARIASDEVMLDDPIEQRIFRISPNSTQDVATARYSVESESDVDIQVRDITGRPIGKFNQGHKSVGVYDVTFDVTGLPPGLYFFDLKTATSTHTEKLMIQR